MAPTVTKSSNTVMNDYEEGVPWPYRPSSPSSPASVEEAIRAVDTMLHGDNKMNDNSDDENDTGGGAAATHIPPMNLLPAFNSKGNFTRYERRSINNEASSKLDTVVSPYGFHFNNKDPDASSLSSLGSNGSRRSTGNNRSSRSNKSSKERAKVDTDPTHLDNKQSNAMDKFLNNPDGTSWCSM